MPLIESFDEDLVLKAWKLAQTGGHRSDEIRSRSDLRSIIDYVRSARDQSTMEVAGTVLYMFCYDQPFGDCNRRTGFILASEMMKEAGYRLVRSDTDVARYLQLFATNAPPRDDFLRWFAETWK